MSPYLILVVMYFAGAMWGLIGDYLPKWLLYAVGFGALGALIAFSASTPASEYADEGTTRGLIYILAFWTGGVSWEAAK